MIKGIDISHFNNPFPWAKLDPNVKFVFMKATEGKTFRDPALIGYCQHLQTTDLSHVGYHFLDCPDPSVYTSTYTVENEAQAQANNYLAHCKAAGIDFSKSTTLPPMLDVEDQVPAANNVHITRNRQLFIQLAEAWIRIVSAATKRKVIIYSYKNFFSEYLINHVFANCYLWLASYQIPQPGLPAGYTHLDFWQYAQYGTLDGRFTFDPKKAEQMGASIDLDYYMGTMDQLIKL